MTTALILAAGLGTRLRTVTSGPKWLVPVGDSSPMQEQLRAVEAADGIDQVVVVASGDTSPLREHLASVRCLLPVDVVINPDAERWNNWSSALVGIEHIGDSGVVLLNSDLFASRDWLVESLLSVTRCTTPALLIDGDRPLTDEAMKVAGDDFLADIGKTGITSPVGEYVGMAWWPHGAARSLTAILSSYRADPAAVQHWYEHGIRDDMHSGTRYERVSTPSVDWVEIDNEQDHELAKALVRTFPRRSARNRTR